jgi:hypothetical protein
LSCRILREGFDQKCSISPEEQNLYWAFAALRGLRAAQCCSKLPLGRKCSKSPEEQNLYWAFAALRRLRGRSRPITIKKNYLVLSYGF